MESIALEQAMMISFFKFDHWQTVLTKFPGDI